MKIITIYTSIRSIAISFLLFILSCSTDSIADIVGQKANEFIGIITSTSSSYSYESSLPITVTFNDDVMYIPLDSVIYMNQDTVIYFDQASGIYFDQSDVIVNNANIDTFFQNSDTSFIFNLTPEAGSYDSITVDIPAGVCKSKNTGELNIASEQYVITRLGFGDDSSTISYSALVTIHGINSPEYSFYYQNAWEHPQMMVHGSLYPVW